MKLDSLGCLLGAAEAIPHSNKPLKRQALWQQYMLVQNFISPTGEQLLHQPAKVQQPSLPRFTLPSEISKDHERKVAQDIYCYCSLIIDQPQIHQVEVLLDFQAFRMSCPALS